MNSENDEANEKDEQRKRKEEYESGEARKKIRVKSIYKCG